MFFPAEMQAIQLTNTEKYLDLIRPNQKHLYYQ